jgi:serine protease AprX
MARITINGVSVDPVKQGPALAAANFIAPNAAASDFILIQTKAPLTKDQRAQLAGMGAEILEYVPDDTYVCHYTPSDLAGIRALPFVAWANIYLRDFKIAPSIRAAAGGTQATANLLSLPVIDMQSKQRVTVEVVLHKGVPMNAAREQIAAAAGLDPNEIETGRSKIRLTVERRRLQALAAIDAVHHVEPYVPPRLYNNIARGILTADAAQTAGTMQGEGEIVCVADTGFDMGSETNVHPAFTGRVVKLYALGRSAASDPDGHGTHVSGSVLGNGAMNDGTAVRGTAPAARLVLQSVLDGQGGLGGLPTDLHDLFITPYDDDGVRIHTNSWGGNAQGAYTANSSEVDDFVWNHRDMLICFAAGNAGMDGQGAGTISSGSVGTPATAKNCITVGASENLRPSFTMPPVNHPFAYGDGWPSDFPVNPIHDDPVANNADGMAAFSSRGPAIHNRVRPDLVAPGTAILSTRSRATSGFSWGPSPPNDPLYMFDGGTSMATPLVAGCAAVVRQFLRASGQPSPSAALIKAMLINGAQPITGQYVPSEAGAPPDNSQGYGRVDLAATVGPYSAGTTVNLLDEATALDTGEEASRQQPIGPGRLLKVTLVWTDQPGEALQADLDLIVTTSDGREWHGNMPAGSTAFDRNNNVEQVQIADCPPGNAEIKVRAFRVTVPQTYALVVRAG